MISRIRTIDFLPEIFRTKDNRQFLSATLDQLVQPGNTTKIEGFIGSKFGYGVNSNDKYVVEYNKSRTDYQLDPAVIFLKQDTDVAKDLLTYPGFIDSVKLEGSNVEEHDQLFKNEFYSWDSFVDLDKLINYSQYYWLPSGPPVVRITNELAFEDVTFTVTNEVLGYSISGEANDLSGFNPTLFLLRGSTYEFNVNQDSPFWIQGSPGEGGIDPAQPNVDTRDVLGVIGNGKNNGTIVFEVPTRDAQDYYKFPGTFGTDLVSSLPFENVNGKRVSEIKGIDKVQALGGKTLMFYGYGPGEKVNVSNFYGYDEFGESDPTFNLPLRVNSTAVIEDSIIVCDSTNGFAVKEAIAFSGITFSGISIDREYYIKEIIDETKFTISERPGGAKFQLPEGTGSLVTTTNVGVFEDSKSVVVNDTLFRINLLGEVDPVIYLTEYKTLPTDTKITCVYGSKWRNRSFVRSPNGTLNLIPYLTADLDTLYYQDGTNPDKVGKIRLVDDNSKNIIDVERDILGQKNYTSPNGIVFTNGLKVLFAGDTFDLKFRGKEYYVEGVGTAIKLIDTETLVVLEKFSQGLYSPFDVSGFDTQRYELVKEVPITPDYITINRSSIDANPWTRSNRWFHYDVIAATAEYNNDPTILTVLNSENSRAKRPIIEFYSGLRVFNSGVQHRGIVDFIDFSVKNIFSAESPLKVVGFEIDYDTDTYFFTSDQINRETATEDPTKLAAIPLFDGARVVFANEEDSTRKKTIYTVNIEKVKETKIGITSTYENDEIQCSSTDDLEVDQVINLSGTPFGGLTSDNYRIAEVLAGNKIKLKRMNGTPIDIQAAQAGSGLMIGTVKVNPVITLSPSNEPLINVTEQVLVRYPNSPKEVSQYGRSYYFNGIKWSLAQEKISVNQPPLFDVVDDNGISFADTDVYVGSTFNGTKLFSYGAGTGSNDSVLGFPIKYSAVYNLGDISFDVDFNEESFNYFKGAEATSKRINDGYVQQFETLNSFTKLLGWETAAGPSFQYQVFNLLTDTTTNRFECDVPVKSAEETPWNPVQVYVNNSRLSASEFTTTTNENSTVVLFNSYLPAKTPVQILLLSDKASKISYYDIPLNLSNNPFNEDITSVSIGEIRGHYQTIFKNYPYLKGSSLGSNNYRDQGKLIQYGTKIIQHSAPMAYAAMFLRNNSHNIFNALTFNANEYVKFKTLLIDSTDNINFNNIFAPDEMLDMILEMIASTRDSDNAFFWSDMIPLGTPYITNDYTFNNEISTTQFNLSKIYDFDSANYNSVLIYLTRTIDGVRQRTLLVRDKDYHVSSISPSVTVSTSLQKGDVITIKEYNQTYGGFVPNTPTKLGMYPAFEPKIYLDDTYVTPTYFLKGHDGSLTKLFGEYNDGNLVDIKDKVLFEFEKRIYNNLKVSKEIAINSDEIIPGQNRKGIPFEKLNEMYSLGVLNWVGQNRLDYKYHFYDKENPFTWNYFESENRLTKTKLFQGGWRGIYLWLYDTDKPHSAPWEMLGFPNKPEWWDSRYGEAPYTSDNLVLWEDLSKGIDWNNGDPKVIESRIRPDLMKTIPVDSEGNLISPFNVIVGNYSDVSFKNEWMIGDMGPTEYSYIRSSTWPFDLMKLYILTSPAKFFGLFCDTDIYKYNEEFKQYLVNNRKHIKLSDLSVYGSGNPKHSYINWIVDYEKHFGVDSVESITSLKNNLDVRLTYRLSGFSDKDLLKFYVEKSTPATKNTSLLIPDASYSMLLYDNQPFNNIEYSSVIIQRTRAGYKVWGNSQSKAYFKIAQPKNNGIFETITLGNKSVKLNKDYEDKVVSVPYGTEYFSVQSLADFLKSYGVYLENQGMIFDEIESGRAISWNQMILEVLYWTQIGWEEGATINVNPAAKQITINKENSIVQPLTMRENIVLNQNLLPIALKDLCVYRDGTEFVIKSLNEGDSLCFFKVNLFNMEHVVVFNNTTIFNDRIYNLVTGLRQQRILVKGSKTAEWDGSVNAYGFILNQDNIEEWKSNVGYTKGIIVKYKNNYWSATKIIQPSSTFNETEWVKTDYSIVQKGLLPNPSLAAYESTIFYDIYKTNLEYDTNLLGFSSIGYRPRQYLSDANLTDVSQINVYKNMISSKGTFNAANNFNGVTLQQGSIEYDLYENWAIKTSEYGGVLNDNFVDIKLDQSKLSSNPNIIGLVFNNKNDVAHQSVAINDVYNYGRQLANANVLPTTDYESSKLPYAGYVNFDDIKISAYNVNALRNTSSDSIKTLLKNEYIWLADHNGTWKVYSPVSLGIYDGTTCNNGIMVTECTNNLDGTATLVFNSPHGLVLNDMFGVINFNEAIDGIYLVADIPSINTIRIPKVLPVSVNTLVGKGLVISLQEQRVSTPSAVSGISSSNFLFGDSKVWVDEDVNGNWAVYKNDMSYMLDTTVTHETSSVLGSAVAYLTGLGILVGDSGAGKAFLYRNNDLENVETINGEPSFGTSIVHNDDMVVISQPFGASKELRKVYIYEIFKSNGLKELRLQQVIEARNSSDEDWGTGLAISRDSEWLFIGSSTENKVYAYAKSPDFTFSATTLELSANVISGKYYIDVVGNQAFGVLPGERLSFSDSPSAKTYTVSNVFWDGEKSRISFTSPVTGNYSTSTAIYNAFANFYLVDEDNIVPETSDEGDKFGIKISTNHDGSKLFVSAPEANETSVVTKTGKVFVFDRIVQNFEIANNFTTEIDLGWTPETVTRVLTNFELLKETDDYSVSGSLIQNLNVSAGDIVAVQTDKFVLSQVIESSTINDGKTNIIFGTGLDNSFTGDELLIGAPYKISNDNKEGVLYRYTSSGKKYGLVKSTKVIESLSSPVTIFINGFTVSIPSGDINAIVNAIKYSGVNNITAYLSDDKLVIGLINKNLNPVKNRLTITALDADVLSLLGIEEYQKTQEITSVHKLGSSQFGYSVKFNQHGSFIVSAPADTRYVKTQFDFIDNDLYNDTYFDNDFTQFIDDYRNQGSVYVYDYMEDANETIDNTGKYVFSQSLVDPVKSSNYQPSLGKSIDFDYFSAMVGIPNFEDGGRALFFGNNTNKQNWSVFRKPADIVDVNKLRDIQIFGDKAKNTYSYVDYIDPLQGKLLGAVQQNIDFISSIDPAGYNRDNQIANGKLVWGSEHVGKIWFNTANVRFVDYHQSDAVYNSKYWGTTFPGSDIAVYTWVESNIKPDVYTGPGVPKNTTDYVTQYKVNSSNLLKPKYYFWVRNTGLVYEKAGKTLSDLILAFYIVNPQSSGIGFFAGYSKDTFGLYNCSEFIKDDSILHIGMSNGSSDDSSYQKFSLIREGNPDDFLTGIPRRITNNPTQLYAKLIDSLTGVDSNGQVVPDSRLPESLRYGVSVRPRQSMFVNRLNALKNYLSYANSVLKQHPITETRNPQLIFKTSYSDQNDFSYLIVDTPAYWEYVNWWANGYSNTTKVNLEVNRFSDLYALNAYEGLIVSVAKNGNGLQETYIYKDEVWTRIGLEKGTIQFKSLLWDYKSTNEGFGDGFFGTETFNQYPSEETKNVIRSLNEEIFINDLLEYRNKSLILIFEYIKSENNLVNSYSNWLNKTSFIDVSQTVSELESTPKYQLADQSLLSGYINEVKPYHVVIKDFQIKYKKTETFEGNISDFDVPVYFDSTSERFVSPQLTYNFSSGDAFNINESIWNSDFYRSWIENYGLSFEGIDNYRISKISSYVSITDTEIYINNGYSFPESGIIKVGNELIGYTSVNRILGKLSGITRGVSNTDPTTHVPGTVVYIDLPGAIVINAGRAYVNAPKVYAYIDTNQYPAPRREAKFSVEMKNDKVAGITVIDAGDGYVVQPKLIIDPSFSVEFLTEWVIENGTVINIENHSLQTGDLVRFVPSTTKMTPSDKLLPDTYYYVRKHDDANFSLYVIEYDAVIDSHRIDVTGEEGYLNLTAKIVPILTSKPTREIKPTIKFDRTSFTTKITNWTSGEFYSGKVDQTNTIASSTEILASLDAQSLTENNNYLPIIGYFTIEDGGVVVTLDLGPTTFSNGQLNGAKVTLVPKQKSVAKTFQSPFGLDLVVSISHPHYASGKVIDEYGVAILDGGSGFTVGDKLQVLGSELGGTDGVHDALIIIAETYTDGSTSGIVSKVYVSGQPNCLYVEPYYIKALNSYIGEWSETETYYYGQTVSYNGIKYTPKHQGDWSTTAEYDIGNIVRYNGSFYTPSQHVPAGINCENVDYWGKIVEGIPAGTPVTSPIWMVDSPINDNLFQVYFNPTLITKVTDFICITNSSFFYIDEIYNVEPSRVIFNGVLYECIQNNNDIEFDYVKWRELKSDDESLNALDRIKAFYRPTVNMPGLDITQLIKGVTYPYNIYYGNAFAPEDSRELETVLKDRPFYGVDVTVADVIWDGGRYIAVVNSDTNASTCVSKDGVTWSINSISSQKFRVSSIFHLGENQNLIIPITRSSSSTDLITCTSTFYLESGEEIKFSGNVPFGGIEPGVTYYVNEIVSSTEFSISNIQGGAVRNLSDGVGYLTFEISGQKRREYYITVTNSSTPMLASYDAVNWISQGPLNSYDEAEYGDLGYDSSALAIDTTLLNSMDYFQGIYVAVGYEIFRSINGVDWDSVLSFPGGTNLENVFNCVKYVSINHFEGFITVGKGQETIVQNDELIIEDSSLLMFSSDIGKSWVRISGVTNKELNSVAFNRSAVIAVGNEGTMIYSTNGINWQTLDTVTDYNLTDIIYANDKFVAVGEVGTILTSEDGINWSVANVNLDVAIDLNSISWSGTEYLVGGTKGIVLTSEDGETWISRRLLSSVEESFYNVTGQEFTSGYSPEEMMSGVITDNISMYVRTNPTINLDPELYEYFGFNMVSFVTKPNTSNVASFERIAETPTSLNVFKMNDSTNQSTHLHLGVDYTVDWRHKTISLAQSLGTGYSLLIELYEFGNGPQIVRANTDMIPLIEDSGVSVLHIDHNFDEFTERSINVFVNGEKLDDQLFSLEETENGRTVLRFDSLYDENSTFISFVIFGQARILYSMPETQVFTYSDSYEFTLVNNLDTNAVSSMVVSLNGLRMDNTKYSLDNNVLTIDSSITLNSGDLISVTTFSGLSNQYIKLDTFFNKIVSEVQTMESIETITVITTKNNHGLVTGDTIMLNNVSGAPEINLTPLQVEVTSPTSFKLYQYYVSSTVNIPILASGTSSDGVVWLIKRGETNYGITLTNERLSSLTDPRRLWVTVDGYRVNPSNVFFYEYKGVKYLGLGIQVDSSQIIMVNSFNPFVVPNQSEYRLSIDRLNNLTAYKANSFNKSWLVSDLFITDDEIYVQNAKNLTFSETFTALADIDDDSDYDSVFYNRRGYTLYEIYLPGNAKNVKNIIVRNKTRGITLTQSTQTEFNDFMWLPESMKIAVHIFVPHSLANTPDATVAEGDVIEAEIQYGNYIIINGEEIKFNVIDLDNNKLIGLTRGVNGTGTQEFIPSYTPVYSVLESDLTEDLTGLS